MLAAEGGHNLSVEFTLVCRRTGLTQKAKIAESNVLVIVDRAGVKLCFDFAHAVLQMVPATKSQALLDFVEVHAIIPLVCVLDPFDASAGEYTPDDLTDLRQRVVQAVIAHVECLTADGAQGRVEKQDDGLRQILHVNERPPLLAVVNRDHAVLPCFCREQIHDQVEARTVRKPENSRESQ